MRKLRPPAALVVYEGEEPGGECCAELTAGSETGVPRCIPSDEGDMVQFLSSKLRQAPIWGAQTQQ